MSHRTLFCRSLAGARETASSGGFLVLSAIVEALSLAWHPDEVVRALRLGSVNTFNLEEVWEWRASQAMGCDTQFFSDQLRILACNNTFFPVMYSGLGV